MSISHLAFELRDRRRGDHARELLVLAHTNLRAWDRVLWLGCGGGWGPEETWRRMRKGYVCGLEQSTEQVSQAQQFRGVRGTLEFASWDGCEIPKPMRSFDRVICCAALGVSPRPDRLLREISRVLVAGGSLSLIEASGINSARHHPPRAATELLAMLVDADFAEAFCIDQGNGWLVASARQPV
jgi:SAM-dependent methyltransferase